MKIKDILDSIEPFLLDARQAEKNLELQPQSQFARRVYIRTLFAYIEGTIWVLKGACLNAKPKENTKRQIGIDEISILLEKTYQLKSNGNIKTTNMNLNLLDNIKFTFKYINHTFTGDIDLQTDKEIWNQLRTAKKIRNRLSHPKKKSDLIISDIESKICQDICSWFNRIAQNAIELMIETGYQEK